MGATWLVGCFLLFTQRPPPPGCRKAACGFATVRGGGPVGTGTRLRLVVLASSLRFPAVVSEAPPPAWRLEAVAKKHCTTNGAWTHSEGGAGEAFRGVRWPGAGSCGRQWRGGWQRGPTGWQPGNPEPGLSWARQRRVSGRLSDWRGDRAEDKRGGP